MVASLSLALLFAFLSLAYGAEIEIAPVLDEKWKGTIDPAFPSLLSHFHNNPDLTSPTTSERDRVNLCVEILKIWTRYIVPDKEHIHQQELVRKAYVRCVRGLPFSEWQRQHPDANFDDYLKGVDRWVTEVGVGYSEQCEAAYSHETGIIELNTQKDKWNPITIHGKGNYFLTSIVHLEHFLEQLTYLIDHERIPVQFREAVSAAKHIIIPDVAAKLNAPNGCEYRYGEPLPAQCRADTRMVWYLLNPWMLGKMQGAFNRLTYLPTATVLTPSNPHCLNPTLDWVSIEDAYLRGDTLVIDQLLTPHCFSELRRLALEGTLFYEPKSTYVGAYIDEGMSEFTWMGILREEFQERFPRVLGKEMPLSTSWFYKYDSVEAKERGQGGIGVHADQALVNINIWLTPDSANLDPTSGGLVVYDKAPDPAEVFGQAFDLWNNFLFAEQRLEWLRENGAANVTVPYRANRAVMFDSKRLHATDRYDFKTGYENRRINLTLLFGDGRIHKAPDVPMTNEYSSF